MAPPCGDLATACWGIRCGRESPVHSSRIERRGLDVDVRWRDCTPYNRDCSPVHQISITVSRRTVGRAHVFVIRGKWPPLLFVVDPPGMDAGATALGYCCIRVAAGAMTRLRGRVDDAPLGQTP